MATLTSPPKDGERVRARWLILAVLALSVLVIGLDGTILNVALPNLSAALGAGTDDLQWIVDSYMLVFAVALLPAGLLGDRYGRKRWLLIGLVLFGAGSALAATTDNVAQLIAARTVMGLGGSLIMPLTMGVLPVIFDRAERPKAIAVWSVCVALGLPLGPILGGYLLDHFWWGSIFLINVPIVIIAVILGVLLVPESRAASTGRVDLLGAVLSMIGLGAFVYGVIQAPLDGWTHSLPWVAGGLLALGLFAYWQTRVRDPLLDVGLFADRNFLWGSISGTVASFGMLGLLFVMPQYLFARFGYDALAVGVRLLPMIAGLAVAARIAAKLAPRFGNRSLVAAGLVVMGAGLGLGAVTTTTSTYAWAALWFVVVGIGVGLSLPTAMDAVLRTLHPAKTGVGSAAVQSMRQVGGALGVAVLGSVLSGVYAHRLDTAGLLAAPAAAAKDSILVALRIPGLADDAVHAFVAGMDRVLLTSAVLTVVGGVLAALFLPGRDAPDPAAAAGDGAESSHEYAGTA
ncbi:DHA2 family efflux MFS transporter permease subunit [Hamadaea tsunoensis]|uniref:DHA2 family efflux MFS transporter permease subunit n=1 Tax=Hamadaea tsunoensis TaxID=53368 RepID=UPI000422EF52|nr:DHA2 family efflux MFS transporter permease subunit [Hamadaea tsunoensis]